MKDENIASLREHLEREPWPSVYMFKMIFPADNRLYAMVRDIFPDEARFFEKQSSKGNYISVTVKELMLGADEVLDRYRKISEIKGVIML
jgi:uncharacterized protein